MWEDPTGFTLLLHRVSLFIFGQIIGIDLFSDLRKWFFSLWFMLIYFPNSELKMSRRKRCTGQRVRQHPEHRCSSRAPLSRHPRYATPQTVGNLLKLRLSMETVACEFPKEKHRGTRDSSIQWLRTISPVYGEGQTEDWRSRETGTGLRWSVVSLFLSSPQHNPNSFLHTVIVLVVVPAIIVPSS